MQILTFLHNGISLQEIESKLQTERKVQTNVEQFVELLIRAGLAYVGEEEITEPSYSHFINLSKTVISLPLDFFKSKLQYWGRFFEYTFGVTLIISIIVLITLTFSDTETAKAMWQKSFRSRGMMNYPFLLLSYASIWLFALPLHEISHALVASRAGIFPRRLTLRLYLFVMPFLSIQIPGLYTLPLRRRLLTLAAGPFMNLLLGNVAWILSWKMHLGSDWQSFMLAFAMVNYMIFLFNWSPFLPTDGYQIISQLLFKDLDIRSYAWASLRYWWRSRQKYPTFSQFLFVCIDFIFIVILIGSILYLIDKTIYKWLETLRFLTPTLSVVIMFVFDIVFALFIVYRLMMLMGIRKS